MASGMFDYGRNAFAKGELHWLASGGDDFRAALIDSGTVAPNLTTHDFVDDLASAIVGSRMALTEIDPVAGACDASDVVFSAVTGATVEGVMIYKYNAADSAAPLVVWVEFTAVTPNGGDITIQWQGTSPFIFKL